MCLGGIWALSPCSMEPKHHFSTAQNITTFVHLTILRHQNTKTAAYQLSKNDWVRPIFLFFGFPREKSFETVAFDRPVQIQINDQFQIQSDKVSFWAFAGTEDKSAFVLKPKPAA